MKILIVGSGPQALFMLKLYATTSNIIVLACIGRKVASHSNIPQKVRSFDSKVDLATFLKSELHNWDLICFAGGYEIQSILETAPEIFNEMNVQPNNLSALKVFASKKETYLHSETLNIASLPSVKLNSALSEGVSFDAPYLLKWDEENTDPQYSKFKTKIFKDLESLTTFTHAFNHEACSKLILQKFLDVDEGGNVSYLGYYSKGKHYFGMLGQQLLQQPIGITAHLVEYQDANKSELISSAITLVESVGLEGFCEVEFLIDPDTKEFYLLEVNPRPCGWSSALLGKYRNISEMVIDGSINPEIKNKNVEWVNILRFLKASMSLGFLSFMKSVIKVPFIQCYDVFSIKDLKPFFSQFRTKK